MGSIKETMKVSLKTLIRHPKLFVPYLIFQGLGAMVAYHFLGEYMSIYSIDSSGTWIAWQMIYYALFLLATPFFEGWVYFLLTIWFTEGRISLQEGILNAKRKYAGFLGFEIIYFASSYIILLPLILVFSFLLAGIVLSKASGETMSSAVLGILLALFVIIMLMAFLIAQTLLAYMKPVYAHVGNFFESLKEGFIATRRNFWRTVMIIALIFVFGTIAFTPGIFFLVELARKILNHEITLYSISLHIPLWLFINAALVGILTRTFLACAFTHFYLTYRKWIS